MSAAAYDLSRQDGPTELYEPETTRRRHSDVVPRGAVDPGSEYTRVRDRDREGEKTLQFFKLGGEKRSEPEVHVEVRTTSRWQPPEQRTVYEVLTRNCAYRLNCKLDCIEVVDLWSGRGIPQHPLLGSWLAGGRRRDDEGEEYSYPLPAPGSRAVFQVTDATGTRMAVTSTVERVEMINQRYRPEHAQNRRRESSPRQADNQVIPLRGRRACVPPPPRPDYSPRNDAAPNDFGERRPY